MILTITDDDGVVWTTYRINEDIAKTFLCITKVDGYRDAYVEEVYEEATDISYDIEAAMKITARGELLP